jgi:entry exclusion lipoprotein TrbK
MVTEKNMNTRQAMVLTMLLAALISACSPQPSAEEKMAAVNDENCKTENIARIKDKEAREQFGGMCIRRGTFKPSPKREW